MKLHLHIDYHTSWGEILYITGPSDAFGGGDSSKAVKMEITDGHLWTASVDIPDSPDPISYRYFVLNDDGHMREEWGPDHVLYPGNAAVYDIFDRWQDQPSNKPFYSSAFIDCILRRTRREPEVYPQAGTVTFEIDAPLVLPDEQLVITGECEQLGNWDLAKSPRMSDAQYPLWKAAVVSASNMTPDTQYKFVIVKKATGDVVAWEDTDNRVLGVKPSLTDATILGGLRFAGFRHWRGKGTAIPVFSLRSDEDFGVGDFYDLMPMIDWAVLTGQTFIQILPINDTTMSGTWMDSYPYNANSTFALHPQYLRLSELGKIHDPARQQYYDDLARKLNDLKEIDYERVNSAKNAYTREIFAQEGDKVVATDNFKAFVAKNEEWLRPYAAFCILRDRFATPEFNKWGKYAVYEPGKVDALQIECPNDFEYVYYIQYNLDKQMRHVRDYAHSKGVAIKGDIPIGISRTSVDAWKYPYLFNMKSQAGAPPDDFSVLGQNWGFPTYSWEEMSKDGFAWWKARFSKMSEYFDAYRIDHVLGFFRIWEIPIDQIHGLLGRFNPALPFSPEELRNSYDFWIDVNLHTTPYIMNYFLGDFFGEYTDEVREKYLEPLGYGRYKLKDAYSNQRKVAEYFATQPRDEKSSIICNGLNSLIDDVLFIPDPDEEGKYHPRISAQHTYIYRSLNDYERWCFNRLYNDFFYHRHNDFWYGKAMWKLPHLIDATDMLVCAEDLGMIPDCVPAVMSALEILSLEIQRMPKDPNSQFGDTWHYPYYSVCTTSTHDMAGIRGWWEEDCQKTQAYYNNVLHEQGDAPSYAEPWICEKILDLHVKSPSMLCIIPLQDWLSMDVALRRENPHEEQINVPKDSRHYWRYRMHLTLHKLLESQSFNEKLKSMER